MPTLLHVTLLAAALAVLAPSSRAQSTTPATALPDGRADKVDPPGKTLRKPAKLDPEALFAGVALDAAQQGKATALAHQSRAAFRAILAKQNAGTPPSAEDRAELKRIGEAHNASYRALLTDAQRARLDANLAALRPATVTTGGVK